jgi:beta-lactamase superfamily II metal-dependent hydrolase
MIPQPSGRLFSCPDLMTTTTCNATWVAGPDGALLVGCGLSVRKILRCLTPMGLDHMKLNGIVVTREHREHTSGMLVLARQLRLPVLWLPRLPGRGGMALADKEARPARVSLSPPVRPSRPRGSTSSPYLFPATPWTLSDW